MSFPAPPVPSARPRVSKAGLSTSQVSAQSSSSRRLPLASPGKSPRGHTRFSSRGSELPPGALLLSGRTFIFLWARSLLKCQLRELRGFCLVRRGVPRAQNSAGHDIQSAPQTHLNGSKKRSSCPEKIPAAYSHGTLKDGECLEGRAGGAASRAWWADPAWSVGGVPEGVRKGCDMISLYFLKIILIQT